MKWHVCVDMIIQSLQHTIIKYLFPDSFSSCLNSAQPLHTPGVEGKEFIVTPVDSSRLEKAISLAEHHSQAPSRRFKDLTTSHSVLRTGLHHKNRPGRKLHTWLYSGQDIVFSTWFLHVPHWPLPLCESVRVSGSTYTRWYIMITRYIMITHTVRSPLGSRPPVLWFLNLRTVDIFGWIILCCGNPSSELQHFGGLYTNRRQQTTPSSLGNQNLPRVDKWPLKDKLGWQRTGALERQPCAL